MQTWDHRLHTRNKLTDKLVCQSTALEKLKLQQYSTYYNFTQLFTRTYFVKVKKSISDTGFLRPSSTFSFIPIPLSHNNLILNRKIFFFNKPSLYSSMLCLIWLSQKFFRKFYKIYWILSFLLYMKIFQIRKWLMILI